MRTKLFIVIICLFSFGCKEEEHKDKLLFIQEILKNPSKIENIIKSSKFYNVDITIINFKTVKNDLKIFPFKIENLEIKIFENKKPEVDGF